VSLSQQFIHILFANQRSSFYVPSDVLNSHEAKMDIEIKLTYTFIDHNILEIKGQTILYSYTEAIYANLVYNNRDEKLLYTLLTYGGLRCAEDDRPRLPQLYIYRFKKRNINLTNYTIHPIFSECVHLRIFYKQFASIFARSEL